MRVAPWLALRRAIEAGTQARPQLIATVGCGGSGSGGMFALHVINYTSADRLAAHAGDVVQSLNALKVESYFDVMFAFHTIFSIPPYQFHARRVVLILT